MRNFFLTLGWIGNFFLIIPALVLIFAQWAPISWMPYSEFIPSDALFQCAFWVGIAFAILVPLSILKVIANEENFSAFAYIKYIVLFILSVILGGVLGYAGTIKGGYVLGNTVMNEQLTDEKPLQIALIEKQHNTVPSRYNYCEYNFNTNIRNEKNTIYESFFLPTTLCVEKELYEDAQAGENIVLLGKGNKNLGFFINGVITQNDINRINKENTQNEETPAESVEN